MDLENQRRVKEAAEEHGAENLVVIIGGAEPDAAGLNAETVISGDPTYAGPLTGAALNLDVLHAVEPEFKEFVDAGVYDEQIGMMEMVLDVDGIIEEMNRVRESANA